MLGIKTHKIVFALKDLSRVEPDTSHDYDTL